MLTCYLNDRENNRDENTKSLSQARLKKRQQEYNETPTKRNANVVEDVHEVASTRLPTALVDEKQLKNNVEKRTAEELQKQIAVAFEAQEKAEHMQDKLFAKEEEYIREERKKRIFVEDPKPNFDIPKEREIFHLSCCISCSGLNFVRRKCSCIIDINSFRLCNRMDFFVFPFTNSHLFFQTVTE